MCSRVCGAARVTALVLRRPFSASHSCRLKSSDITADMSYRARGGYGVKRGRGPNRRGGRGSERRGGGHPHGAGWSGGAEGVGGGDAPPPDLRGRALGMWYASRSKSRKKKKEIKEVRKLFIYLISTATMRMII